MFRISIKESYAMNSKVGYVSEKSEYKPNGIWVYGACSCVANVKVGDILIEDYEKEKAYKVLDFPMVRRAEYKADHIDIFIRPIEENEDVVNWFEYSKIMVGKVLITV